MKCIGNPLVRFGQNLLFAVILSLFGVDAQSQLYVNHKIGEHDIVNEVLLGEDLQVRNIHFRGVKDAMGIFYNENTNLPLDSGVILSTGYARAVLTQNVSQGMTGLLGSYGDHDLTKLAGAPTYDATVLNFDFVPAREIIKFRYVFGSEEYPEYVDKGFNDVFAFFLIDLETGDTVNLAVLPETGEPVSIDRINHLRYSSFYIDNTDFKPRSVIEKTIEFDGFTRPLLAYSEVRPGGKYRIKIAVADAGDAKLDSGVFLEAGSFESKDRDDFYAENKRYFLKFEGERKKLAPSTARTEEGNSDSAVAEEVRETEVTGSDREDYITGFTVYFDFDEREPREGEIEKLEVKLREFAERADELEFVISGHTDDRGTGVYNDGLSRARAEWVRDFMAEYGIDHVFKVNYFNFEKPARSNESSEGRAANRRVEVKVRRK